MFYWYSLCALSACSALKTQSSFHAQTDEGKCYDQAPPPPQRKGILFSPARLCMRGDVPTYLRTYVVQCYTRVEDRGGGAGDLSYVQGGARRRSAPSGRLPPPTTTLFLHFRAAKFKSALKVRDSPNRLHLCAALEGHLHAGS